ncbi:MAG: thioredoxin family protein [Phycisphaerales bacterium]
MLTNEAFRAAFAQALPYDAYLATGKPHHRDAWGRIDAAVSLTPAQRELLGAFIRPIRVLVLSGTWCGDCAQQCPILRHIAAASRAIDLRFVDRDVHRDLAEQVKICGGFRVPTVIFANEDDDFLAILGDRTLSRYRALAAAQLGPSCPLPGAPVPPQELAATTQDWIDEFERVHLMVRLSPKLRERHGD